MHLQRKITGICAELQFRIAMPFTTLGCTVADMKSIGKKIAAARLTKGLNQSELARQLDVTPQSVQAWESDKNVPRAQKLRAICAALDINLSDLMAGSIAIDQADQKPEVSSLPLSTDSAGAQVVRRLGKMYGEGLLMNEDMTVLANLAEVLSKKNVKSTESDLD